MFAGTYMTDKSRQHGLNQWGPSDTTRSDGVPVKALTKEMLAEIVAAYGTVAGLAKRAGFEMLLIHGGQSSARLITGPRALCLPSRPLRAPTWIGPPWSRRRSST